jgi:hypothetical protein
MYQFVTRGFSNHETVIEADHAPAGSLAAMAGPCAGIARDGLCPAFALGGPKIPLFCPAAVIPKGLF